MGADNTYGENNFNPQYEIDSLRALRLKLAKTYIYTTSPACGITLVEFKHIICHLIDKIIELEIKVNDINKKQE